MATSAAMGRGGSGEGHGLELGWGVGQDESQPGRRARGSWRIENSAEDAGGPAFPASLLPVPPVSLLFCPGQVAGALRPS